MTSSPAAEAEHWHLRNLAVWSAGSIAAGVSVWAVGRARQHRAAAAFGKQNVMWGAVDGAIVAIAKLRGPRPEDPARSSRLRRVLLINAALDVGYVAAGAVAMTAPSALIRPPRYLPADARGDGAAIILQGGFLLVADLAAAGRLASAERAATGD